jgi:hypothetical protein
MRTVPYQKVATIEFLAPAVPDGAGTFIVYNVSGAVQQASTAASFTPLSTTLTGNHAAGVTALVLADTTGVVAGRKYLLAGPEETGGEWVLVRKVVDGTHLTLARGLLQARSSMDTFQSTRVTFTVGAVATANSGRNFRIEWEWASGLVTQPPAVLPFDVCRYTPVTGCTFETVRTLDPLAAKRIPQGTWMPDLLTLTWDMLLRRVAAQLAPGAVVGTVDLSLPHGYLTLVVLLEPGAGEEETRELIDRLERRFKQELDACMSSLSTDENGDGNAKSGEPGWGTHSIPLQRR